MDNISTINLAKQYNTTIQKLTNSNNLVLDDIPPGSTLAEARTIINSNNEKIRTLITKATNQFTKINNVIDYLNEYLTNRSDLETKINRCIDYINRHEDRQTR